MTGQFWIWHVILLAPGTAPPGPAGRWSHQRAREASRTPIPVITSLRVDAVDMRRPMTIAIIVSLSLLRVYSILLTRTATVRPMQPLSSSAPLYSHGLKGGGETLGSPAAWSAVLPSRPPPAPLAGKRVIEEHGAAATWG